MISQKYFSDGILWIDEVDNRSRIFQSFDGRHVVIYQADRDLDSGDILNFYNTVNQLTERSGK